MKQILLFVAGLFCAGLVPAQELPVLPKDQVIRNGVLPNGLHYYIAENPSIKGIADFALVQRTGTENIADTMQRRTVAVSREALSAMPRCKEVSVQTFFTSHGVVPGRNGFVRVYEDATTFSFRDVMLSSPAVTDSVLLVLMDIVDRVSTTEDPFVKKWYSPSDQAVIIAGDVNAKDVEFKLNVLSMMTPAAVSSPRKEYVWRPSDSPVFFQVEDNIRDLAVVSATWRSSRPPVEVMNTVQPVIYQLFLMELEKIASQRIISSLKAKDIPVADVSAYHRTALQSHGDESFTVEVSVANENLRDAVEIISSVMSSIDAGNVEAGELAAIKRECIDELSVGHLLTVKTNAAYIDKCTTAFLYNGDLSTVDSKIDFVASRDLSNEAELSIFNNIASALLDSERNLSLGYYGDIHPDTLARCFAVAWKGETDTLSRVSSVTLPEYVPSGEKIKIRSEKNDSMSGGIVWTFSNGFKVVYKKLDTDGRMFYDLALNGGFGSIGDLKQGEGGYIGDYLFLSRICGMKSKDFLDILKREGISMDSYVGLSNMMLSGYAPKDRIHLMMRALIAVMNERDPDPEAAGYYAGCEALRYEFIKGTSEEKEMEIDRIMYPDYMYASYKGLSSIPEDLMHKADRYFKEQSSKINDGVLVLVGDMDESQLKKILLFYAGGFKMTDKAFRRPVIKYTPASGWSTYTVEGRENAVDVALSVPLALSADNFMAAEMVSLVLKKHLSRALTDTGMYLDLTHDCRIYPHERFTVLISLREAMQDGYSSDTEVSGPMEALSILRSALSDLSAVDVTEEELAVLKTQMKSAMVLQMMDPYYWLNVISRRYLAGKDFTTNINAKIDAVTIDRVRNILKALDEGSKVEYITSIQ